MHPNEDAINGYVEEALEPAERQEVERHLQDCTECRRLADDLAEIRRVAASLDPREPPARAWLRLERAVSLEPGKAAGRSAVEGWRRSYASPVWLAAAAALIIVTGIGIRIAMSPAGSSGSSRAANSSESAATEQASAEAVEAELRAAEAHYDKAIKGLEQIANAEQNALDPKTAATLQKNLAVIDQAISESRAAVRAQPSSEPAVSSLMDAFKTKLALLQDTVALINEMRKGNDAGTARIVSGLKQRGN
jgi:anti-sigma factor RsiW